MQQREYDLSLLTHQLKCETTGTHDTVDNLVMSVNPFENVENYGKFLQLQEIFHKIVDDIYMREDLNRAIPGLAATARHAAVLSDMADLGVEKFPMASLPAPKAEEAIGWLYCAEGSNLGAAFLYKEVNKINLDAERGARHLAAHSDGRGKHWRNFSELLNAIDFDAEERESAVKGANEAFTCYKKLLRMIFELPEPEEQAA
ncbi:biliverdin-producing heme oxygenase [Ignatzschineria rhizosphaerae]|uniref:Biliverdin-producing heme oxygenase n=1 Tax=Ignatzschineria rhizosphaerae TaxID=2923279 RepID=A0ABY3X684_9GAMM|nr:biliverdin-producing heme oxygenase [Ignatzschineria rhizosphaerae]UNM97405.1 biliverdin-producing heme oxygenase [Ignatzschineria rhizosphaerae]